MCFYGTWLVASLLALLPMNIFLSSSFSQEPVFMWVLLIATVLFFGMFSKEKAVGLRRYFIGLSPLILFFFASNNKAFARCQGFLKEYQVLSVSIYFLVLLLLATTLRYYT